MSAVNPYTPPQAQVADAPATSFSQPRIWGFRGRIGRLRYLAYVMGGYLLFVVLMALFGGIAGAMGSTSLVNVIVWVGLPVYLLQSTLAGIQRAHDMNWSGWSVLAILIPLVGLIWLFNPGTPGANRFGAPPPPNTTGVKILAWAPLAIFIIGIVAAIALPAYQGYLIRANSAQGAPR